MKSTRIALAALAICAAQGAAAQLNNAFNCPPGSTPVSTGQLHVPSCVGSPTQGLVEQTLPYQSSTLFGITIQGPRPANPIFTLPERPPVLDSPNIAKPMGHFASTSTPASAFNPYPSEGLPAKLSADWKYLFNGPQVIPGTRLSWMGGVLSRDNDGALRFSTQYAGFSFSGPMEPYRNDIGAFLQAAGPATARLISERYGIEPYGQPALQAQGAAEWDMAMNSRRAPGSTQLVGNPATGQFATVVYGRDGQPQAVVDATGTGMDLVEFTRQPRFTAITGRGVYLPR